MAVQRRAFAPWLAALLVWLAVVSVSGAREGPRRALKSSGIVVRSIDEQAFENSGRRILVEISKSEAECQRDWIDDYETPDYDYKKTDYYRITDSDLSYDGEETWTNEAIYSDVAYLSVFLTDKSESDEDDSKFDFYVYDETDGESKEIKSFEDAKCIFAEIDATSRCPEGAKIRIKTYCSTTSGAQNCMLKRRITWTTASTFCDSSPPSLPRPSPSPSPSPSRDYSDDDYSPSSSYTTPSSSSSYYAPNTDSDSGGSLGVIIGAAVGGVVLLSVGAIGALLIVRRRRQRKLQALNGAPGPNTGGSQAVVLPVMQPAGSSTSVGGSDIIKAAPAADAWAYATSPPPEAMFPPTGLQHDEDLGKNGAAMAAAAVAAPASMPLSSPADSAASLSRRRTSSQSLPIATTDPLLQYVTTQLVTASATGPVHDLAAWELRFEELDISSFLGEGSWGRVYKARYQGADVAVKILLNDDKAVNAGSAATLLSMSTPVMARLSQEASIMAQLSHPHCISMIGVTTIPAAVVQEYAARGSLLDVLRAAKEDPDAAAELTWARRISICIGTAKGMAYLHGRQPQPVVHRDLKSANVLLTQDWTAKVADFGLSKVMTESARSATRAAMNPRWLSPEILKGTAGAQPADVFAFGVVLWELLSWELPWGATGPWVIVGALSAGERPPIPPRSELPGPPGTAEWEGLDAYLALMQRCWAQEPQDRPSFEEIIQDLETMAPPLPPTTVSEADSPPQTPLSPSSVTSEGSTRSRRPSSATSDPLGRRPWR